MALFTERVFEALQPPLSSQTLEVLREHFGFRYLTPVQAHTIPKLIESFSVAVNATTGSGKTLAFVIPVVERLRIISLKPHQVGALIISPTRELASQIFHVASPFFNTMVHIDAMLLVGGTDISVDLRKLETCRANVLIGTPGRIYDIMQRVQLDWHHLKMLILDEADRLLDMGFHRHISEIIGLLPEQRTTGLFSATQTYVPKEWAEAGLRLHSVLPINIEGSKTPATLNVQYLVSDADEKSSQLVYFLLQNASKKTIVYFITCASVDYWGAVLSKIQILKHIEIIALHGKLKQRMRAKALQKFASMPSGVLFCTDVAARGLDIPGVDWIVQYDPPQDPNMFIHRVGRTARMGRSGDSVVFLLPKEDAYVEFLRIRGVPPTEKNKPAGVTNIIPMLREIAAGDFDVMQKGLRAFVSFFRAYKEHHCNFILQWKQLKLGKLAMGFGLLQLPSMPELKRGIFNAEHFVPMEGIDVILKRRGKPSKKLAVNASHGKLQKTKPTQPIKTRGNKRSLKDYEEINEDYRQMRKLQKKLRSS